MTPSQFKAIRRSLKFSQAKMAKHLGGYSVSTIRKWEYGINRMPKAVVALLSKRQQTLTRIAPVNTDTA